MRISRERQPTDIPTRSRVAGGGARGLAIAVGALAVVGTYSRWKVAPWVTPWLGPVLAVAGAAFVSWRSARVLGRILHGKRPSTTAAAINAAALILFVILPLARLPGAFAPLAGGRPRLLSGFNDWRGAEGYPRMEGRHSGVDLAARVGSAVLAPAPGRVLLAEASDGSCGLIVVIDHERDGYRTIYCHLSATAVARGERVERGQRIGAVGVTGMRPWPGYEHLHWELQKGKDGPREDPLRKTTGCFDAATRYGSEELVLAYPLSC